MASKTKVVCAWCGEAFEPGHHLQLYCNAAHREAHTTLRKVRGTPVVLLLQAWRASRNTKNPTKRAVGAHALGEVCRMVDEWSAEDRAAGRPDAIHLIHRQALAEGRDIVRPVAKRKPRAAA